MNLTKLFGLSKDKGSKKITCAVVGLSNIAKSTYLPLLAKNGKYKICYVVSSSIDLAKGFARKYQCIPSNNYADVLQDPSLDLVIITNKNKDHAPYAIQAAEAGKHILLEKPVALTKNDCARIARAVEKKGVVCSVLYNRTFSPYVQIMKQRLGTGKKIIYQRFSRLVAKNWRDEQGGAVLDMYGHVFNLMEYLLDAKPVEFIVQSIETDDKKTAEENAVTVIKYDDGSLLTLLHTTMGNTHHGREMLHIFTNGLIYSLRDYKELKITSQKGTIFFKKTTKSKKGFKEQLDAFADYLRTKQGRILTLEEGIRCTNFCIDVAQKIKSQKKSA